MFLLPSYLLRFQVFGLPTTMLELAIVVFLFVVLIKFYKDLPVILKLGHFNWIVAAFILAGIISTLISPEFTKALGQFKAFILEPILIFYGSFLIIKNKEDLRIPLTYLSVSTLLISLFGVLQYYTFLNLPIRFWGYSEGVRRITSFLEYPNALALLIGPIFIFLLSLLVKNVNLINRKLLIIATIFSGLALFLTFSRGAWLAVLSTTAILFSKKYSWKLIVPASVVIVAMLLLLPKINDRIFSPGEDSAHSRLELYKVAAVKIFQNPILGNGLYGFRTTLAQTNYQGEILNYPHNIILNFWLELGMIGVLSFFAIILFCLRQYKTNPTDLNTAAAMFLLVIFLHGLVDVPYFKNDLSILFWFMISIFYISKNEAQTI